VSVGMPADPDAERLDQLFGSRPHIRVSRLSEDDTDPRPSPAESPESTGERDRDRDRRAER